MSDRDMRLERAKAILRFEASVLAHWVDELPAALSAERLGVSRRTIHYTRAHLRIESRQGGKGGARGIGRSREYSQRMEVPNG